MLLRYEPKQLISANGMEDSKSPKKNSLRLRVADRIAKFVCGLKVLLISQIFQLVFKKYILFFFLRFRCGERCYL